MQHCPVTHRTRAHVCLPGTHQRCIWIQALSISPQAGWLQRAASVAAAGPPHARVQLGVSEVSLQWLCTKSPSASWAPAASPATGPASHCIAMSARLRPSATIRAPCICASCRCPTAMLSPSAWCAAAAAAVCLLVVHEVGRCPAALLHARCFALCRQLVRNAPQVTEKAEPISVLEMLATADDLEHGSRSGSVVHTRLHQQLLHHNVTTELLPHWDGAAPCRTLCCCKLHAYVMTWS
jgi:hypothetical protein